MKKYELILRCDSFNLWPENQEFGIRLNKNPRNLIISGKKILLSYAVRSYANDREINVEKPAVESSAGPGLWTERVTGGRQLGTVWLVALNEHMDGRIILSSPTDGQIDVLVRCESEEVLDEGQLSLALNPLVYKLAAFLRLSLDPNLSVPTSPQLVVYAADGKRTISQKITMSVAERHSIDGNAIKSATGEFAKIVDDLSADDISRLESASRRVFSLQREMDSVDRFCDAWEICEILSKQVRARGTVVSRVATAIAAHIGVKKEVAEKRLRLTMIYSIRKDLVHNGIEEPFKMVEGLPLVENIALELLRQQFALKYEGNSVIDAHIKEAK